MAKQRRDIMGDDGIYILYMLIITVVLSMYAMSSMH